MSDIGTSITNLLQSGILESASLLAFLGADECQSYLLSAMNTSVLHAAAVPLSIFGSLGTLSAAFDLLISRWRGGRLLTRRGPQGNYSTRGYGSVLPLLLMDPESRMYGVDALLLSLLEKAGVGPEPSRIVSVVAVKWPETTYHWRSEGRALSWNWTLFFATLTASIVALAPYSYHVYRFNLEDWPFGVGSMVIFTVSRCLGSLVCVVCIQLALQRRILRMINISLLLLQLRETGKLDQLPDLKEIEEQTTQRGILKKWLERVDANLAHARSESALKFASSAVISTVYLAPPTPLPLKDVEQGFLQSQLDVHVSRAKELLSPDGVLHAILFFMFIGAGIMTIGYLGCLDIVNTTSVDAPNGPYVWLAAEIGLSAVRYVIWAYEPSWAKSRGMVLELRNGTTEVMAVNLDVLPNRDNGDPVTEDERNESFSNERLTDGPGGIEMIPASG